MKRRNNKLSKSDECESEGDKPKVTEGNETNIPGLPRNDVPATKDGTKVDTITIERHLKNAAAERSRTRNVTKFNLKSLAKEETNQEDIAATSNHNTTSSWKKDHGEICKQFKTAASLTVLLLFLAYTVGACIGLSHQTVAFEPEHLWPEDTYSWQFMHLASKHFRSHGQQLNIVVNKAPHLWDETKQTKLFRMMEEFENTEYTYGREYSENWFSAYCDYLGRGTEAFNDVGQWTTGLFQWCSLSFVIDQFANDILWREVRPNSTDYESCGCRRVTESFKFRVTLRNFGSSENKQKALKLMRQIAAKYAEFDVTTYHYTWPYVEQDLNIRDATMKSVGLAVVCVLFITALFIPSVACVVGITAVVISIDIGIFGYLALWGVSLDSISMVTLLMSIGLSIDYNAHVSYAYMIQKGSGFRRVVGTLRHVGFPVAQGAVSTLLGVLALSTVDSRIGTVFFKSVFLVVTISALHSCVFFPALLWATDGAVQWVRKLSQSSKSVPVSPNVEAGFQHDSQRQMAE